MRIYLAGPEVFFADPLAESEWKKGLLAEMGHEGCFPLDNQIQGAGDMTPQALGREIGRANVELMDSCDAIIANLSPWHGPSADVGTVSEIIYMGTLGKPVAAYSPGDPDFLRRVEAHFRDIHPGAGFSRGPDGRLFAPDGHSVEEFGLFDNLMLPHFLEKWGARLHPSFTAAAEDLTKRMKANPTPSL